MLIAALGRTIVEPFKRSNAFKTMAAASANGAASLVFVVATPVSWRFAVVLASASLMGGLAGAAIGRRVPPAPRRLAIGVLGLLAAIRLGFVALRIST